MIWLDYPKRLQTALMALSVMAGTDTSMLCREIARNIGVPQAETAKVLQLLVWAGFVRSRRGSKGGFELAVAPNKITVGAVVQFFSRGRNRHKYVESAVSKAWNKIVVPCHEKFGRLTIAEIATPKRPKC